MSQNDMVLANQSGASYRADNNSALQALASASAGATAPSTTYQYQYWFDTTLNIQKQRNGANTAWVNLWSLVGSTLKLYEQGALLLARANTWTALQTFTGGLVGPATQAKAINYTAVLADAYSTLVVDASGAARTITLPAAAAAGAGYELGIEKIDSSVNAAIVDANGSETIDAPGGNRLAVNLVSQHDRIRLISRGSKWTTLDHRISFESAEQTITSAGSLTIAHGLGVRPDGRIDAWLVCQTAEVGYSVGDRVPVNASLGGNDGTAGFGLAVVLDATNINVRYGSFSSPFVLINNTTGAQIGATNANWRLVFKVSL